MFVLLLYSDDNEELANRQWDHVAIAGRCNYKLNSNGHVVLIKKPAAASFKCRKSRKKSQAIDSSSASDSEEEEGTDIIVKVPKKKRRSNIKSQKNIPASESSESDASPPAPKKIAKPKKLSSIQDKTTKNMAVDFLPLPGSGRRKQSTPQKRTPQKNPLRASTPNLEQVGSAVFGAYRSLLDEEPDQCMCIHSLCIKIVNICLN